MQDLVKSFGFNGQAVRTVVDKDMVWFCVADVCDILEIHTGTAKKRLLDSEKGVFRTHTPGGPQMIGYTTESGLYKLIMRSDKEQAQKFQDWIAEEVLPSIRRTGNFNLATVNSDGSLLVRTNALLLELSQEIERQREVVQEQARQITIMEPKAEICDQFLAIEDASDLSAVAKALGYKGIGRSTLIEILLEEEILFRNDKERLEPYQPMINRGICETELITVKKGMFGKELYLKTKFTPKGILHINELLKRLGHERV